MKKQSLKKQKGMTMISWAVVLVFVGFQFLIAIKIIPVFAEVLKPAPLVPENP